MNTTTTHRFRPAVAAVAAGLTLTFADPAAGIPDRRELERQPARGASASTPYEPGTRPCFLHRAHWNEALDGPQPRC
jgi:hypothetical protein